MRPSIFGSMTRRHTLSDPVRSLKPQIVSAGIPRYAGLGEQRDSDVPGPGGRRPTQLFAQIADCGRLMTERSRSTAPCRSSSSGLANASLCAGDKVWYPWIIMVRRGQAGPTPAG